MKRIILSMALLLGMAGAHAQSKVFREVSSEISTQFKLITQDESLIGYLAFTQLEKVNKDSFNYQVTIMDENLNDIGKLNFKDKNLELLDVSFEQDILCLAYVKSDIADVKNTSMKKIRKAMDGSNAVYTQLVNLKGEILHSSSIPVDLAIKDEVASVRSVKGSMVVGRLKRGLMMKNIPGKGFACFFGDEEKNTLRVIDIKGTELWSAKVPDGFGFNMLTTGSDVYLISRERGSTGQGGWNLRGYAAATGSTYDAIALKDKKGNSLSVISFENDPRTGRPVLSGDILTKGSESLQTVAQLKNGYYSGVYSMYLNGPRRSQVREVYSYWNDGSKAPAITANGKFQEAAAYPVFAASIRDNQGNTYFAGPTYIKKAQPGKIVASVLFSWTLIVPVMLAGTGFNKAREMPPMVLRQDSLGRISFTSSIPGNPSRYVPNKAGFGYFPGKAFYKVSNSEGKANYLIVDASDKAVLYNVDSRKVIREVPHKSGSTRTYILPAKEGHIMVVESNTKEKYTKLSIESV
ncbi:MAG: hypothetical protein EOO08_11000 [Chitinophagaceae bacterium]|nr:MAG: hypothetical protein EOO08_11000 [Chitinophagaceae bacterium]